MKTNAQLLDEITAAMADVWLAACDRRVIGTTADLKCVVFDMQGKVGLFGPASADECRLYIHRAAALDVLRMLGTERVARAAMEANSTSTEASIAVCPPPRPEPSRPFRKS
jgi:hypothetical protein